VRSSRPTSGTLTFTKGGPTELSFAVETFDDSRFEGDEQIVIRLTNAVGAERGSLFQGSVLIVDNDPFDPDEIDRVHPGRVPVGRRGSGHAGAHPRRGDRRAGASRAGRGRGPRVRPGAAGVDIEVKGNVCRASRGRGVVPVHLLSTPYFDATTVDHTTVTLGDATRPASIAARASRAVRSRT
jgi:hypothetical protein